MKSFTIVGYTYRAENVHPQCLRLQTGEGEPYDGWALADGVRMTAEDNLNEVAAAFGINRMDESSYDSDEFPKVIFADSVIEGETCDRCGEDLIEFSHYDPWQFSTPVSTENH